MPDDAARRRVVERARAHGMGVIAERLGELASACVQLTETETETEAEAVAEIGGRPWVPAGFEWPVADGVPLVAWLQVDLERLGGEDLGLPSAGKLTFFLVPCSGYRAPHECWSAQGGRLLWSPPSASWVRASPPADATILESRPLGARRSTDLPASGSVLVSEELRAIDTDEEQRREHAYELSEDELPPEDAVDERYETLLGDLGVGPVPTAQLLGHPAPCQDDPLLEHARALKDPPPTFPIDAEVARELRQEARRWRLLAQAPANPRLGYDILGGGWVYFLIPGEDLAARRFDRVVALCQR